MMTKKITLALLMIGYIAVWYVPLKSTNKQVDDKHQIASIK